MNEPLVFARKEGQVGRLTLNRAKALHALNLQMCEQMITALQAWKADPDIAFILVDHAEGTRGFRAGGDVRMLAESGAVGGEAACEFFAVEYRLNTLIKSYPKPYVSFIDGIVMGGGVGISVHGSRRIATERTTFAMPETGIGLFPDVGGTWFLPRLRGRLGTWLALSGERLKGQDVLAAGIATHFVPSGGVEALKAKLLAEGLDGLEADSPRPELSFELHMAEIDEVFGLETVEEIISALERGSEWAVNQAHVLAGKSPLSMAITLRQMREGAGLKDFQGAMALEYRIASRLVCTPNFQEGVRAVLIDRDNTPAWEPASLEQIDNQKIESFFAPLASGELVFLEGCL